MGVLEGPRKVLGASLRGSWRDLGASRGVLRVLRRSWGDFEGAGGVSWGVWGSSWCGPGVVLGGSWGGLGVSWGRLWRSWVGVGTLLGRFGRIFKNKQKPEENQDFGRVGGAQGSPD